MTRLTEYAQYQAILEKFKRKGCLSNDYLQTRAEQLIAQGQLFAYCHDHNAYLLERKDNCFRMYYYLNDLTTIDAVAVSDQVLVTEILYRGNSGFPTAERDYLAAMGFKENLVRDQYAATHNDLAPAVSLPDVLVREAVDGDEVEWACDLFNATFDPYSGDFVPREEYAQLLNNGQILVAVDRQGTRLGALHQTVERNVAWISHVAVPLEMRGRHVGQALLDAFADRNHTSDKSRYMLWVQQQNTAAVAMYQKKGFRYINKSTLSLIKNN